MQEIWNSPPLLIDRKLEILGGQLVKEKSMQLGLKQLKGRKWRASAIFLGKL